MLVDYKVMQSSAPPSPLGRLLADRFSQLSGEVHTLFMESREKGRNELAEQLNQSVRRLRQSEDREELAATLVDAASAFADGAALFRVEAGIARGRRIRGVPEAKADSFLAIEIPLSDAAAFGDTVENRDPVTAITSAAEVSTTLMQFLEHMPDGRVSIYPLVVNGETPALLYTWGAVDGPVVELMAQVAAAVWIGLEIPAAAAAVAAPSDLVQIAATQPPPPPKPSWDMLPPEQQQIHFRAQRFARVQAAEMRLYQADAVQSGRGKRNLYGALRQTIDQARKHFHESFYLTCPSMVDYLHLELVHTLANEDPELLGPDYPGPLA